MWEGFQPGVDWWQNPKNKKEVLFRKGHWFLSDTGTPINTIEFWFENQF